MINNLSVMSFENVVISMSLDYSKALDDDCFSILKVINLVCMTTTNVSCGFVRLFLKDFAITMFIMWCRNWNMIILKY